MAELDGIRRVGVVVPAHDEEALIGGCLAAVGRSAAVARRADPALEVLVVVVLDRCSDGTAAVAVGAGACVVTSAGVGVGAARRTGHEVLARWQPALPAAQVWAASTDADTEVPVDWLAQQLDAAREGARLVLGTVRPRAVDLEVALLRAWEARHPAAAPGSPGAHVHGANLGVRLDAYLAAGGYPAVLEHEDRLLVDALRAQEVLPVAGTRAVTSGRRQGRVAGGFSGYLRALAATL